MIQVLLRYGSPLFSLFDATGNDSVTQYDVLSCHLVIFFPFTAWFSVGVEDLLEVLAVCLHSHFFTTPLNDIHAPSPVVLAVRH